MKKSILDTVQVGLLYLHFLPVVHQEDSSNLEFGTLYQLNSSLLFVLVTSSAQGLVFIWLTKAFWCSSVWSARNRESKLQLLLLRFSLFSLSLPQEIC